MSSPFGASPGWPERRPSWKRECARGRKDQARGGWSGGERTRVSGEEKTTAVAAEKGGSGRETAEGTSIAGGRPGRPPDSRSPAGQLFIAPPGAGRQQAIAAVPRQQGMVDDASAVAAGKAAAARSAKTAARAIERRIGGKR